MHRIQIHLVCILASVAYVLAPCAASAQPDHPQLRRSTHIEALTPNPWDPGKDAAAITIVLMDPGDTELKVFALDGREVAVLIQQPLPAGRRTVYWDGRNPDGSLVANGAYILRLKVGELVRTATLIVTRAG